MPTATETTWQMFLHQKIHVADGAYAQSGREVQARFPSGWSAAIETVSLLSGLPETAIDWWAGQANGHLLLTSEDDTYAHSVPVDGALVRGVSALPMRWLIEDRTRVLALALRPLDHLLGCEGEDDGRWLSDAGGITSRWQQVGGRINHLFSLGYGATEASRQDPHAYLAEGLALALTDRRALNIVDPKLERLLFTSLLSPGFWNHAI